MAPTEAETGLERGTQRRFDLMLAGRPNQASFFTLSNLHRWAFRKDAYQESCAGTLAQS